MSRSVRNRAAAAGALAMLVLVAVATAAAPAPADVGPPAPPSADEWSAPEPGPHARPGPGRMFGVVPAAGRSERPSANELAGTSFADTSPLTYHGGPVMLTNTTYAIYWLPPGSTVSAGYTSLIDRYLGDVAAASGATTNVYSPDVQYYQGSGTHAFIQYASTFAGSAVDSSTPIPDHCSSQYTSRHLTVSGCITDADIQAELAHVIASQGWTPGPTKIFLLFTPRNVGSCFGSGSSTCSYTYYCAYHSDYFDGGGRDVIYANQPYPDTTGVGTPGACDSGEQPNGDWADETINLISHEHNEAITDPQGNAWYDASGNENGDKCAWDFGTPLGSTAGGRYNQLVNGNPYYVQREWSNASSSCVLGYAPAVAPAITGFSPASGPRGTSVTITGTGFTGATAVQFHGAAATFTVDSATQVTAVVPQTATTGTISVTTAQGTATSPDAFTVTASPKPDFSLAASPASLAVARGTSATSTITITRLAGFAGSVQLKAGGLPGSTTATFSPSTVPSGGTTSTLTILAKSNAKPGTYTVKITGSGSGLNRTTTVTLTVT